MSDPRPVGRWPALTVALLVAALLVWWAMNGAQRQEARAASGDAAPIEAPSEN